MLYNQGGEVLDITRNKVNPTISRPINFASKPASESSEPLEMPQMTSLEGPSPLKISGIFAVIVGLIFVSAFGLLFFIKYSRTNQLKLANAKLAELTSEITSTDLKAIEDSALRYGQGVDELSSFNAKYFLWTKFLTELEKTTPKDLKFSSISASGKDAMNFKGDAANYDSVAKLMQSMDQSGKFSQIKLVSASGVNTTSSVSATTEQAKGTSIKFELSAKINKSVFK